MEMFTLKEFFIVTQLILDVYESQLNRLCDVQVGSIKEAAILNDRLSHLQECLQKRRTEYIRFASQESMAQEATLLKSLDESADTELTAENILMHKTDRMSYLYQYLENQWEEIRLAFDELDARALDLTDKVWEKM